jgi:alkyl hydroperoxide reductase subunit AhpC
MNEESSYEPDQSSRPHFELEGYFKGEFRKYPLADYREVGPSALYPLDFTFVCPTEVLTSQTQLKIYSTQLSGLGMSVDSVFVHKAG